MKKKALSFLLILTMLCTLCCGAATAAELRSSEILASCMVTMTSGSGTGEVKINYSVKSSRTGTVGVESIEIYKSNGTYVTTITGTTGNGLMKSGAYQCSGTYTYKGVSGTYYYAVVTVSATAGSVYGSDSVTTGTAKAP